jgi:rubrerythrin
MTIFEYAMQVEKDGEEFYRKLLAAVDDKGLKAILTMLADEEVKHYKALKKMQSEETGMAETTILSDSKNIFEEMKNSGESIQPDTGQIKLYKEAQNIEQKSREFYQEKAEEVSQEYQRRLFLRLAEEERKHYVLLDNIIEFVQRPDTWLENAEFCHLEEY